MLQSVNDLKGFTIFAADGEVGSVEEFYFEDTSLAVRFLVANTGSWLTDKKNLISPLAITHLDREKRSIHVTLTVEQVRQSPGIDKHQPVSRQMEKLVSDYYGNRYYWEKRPDLTAAQLSSANNAAATVKAAVTPPTDMLPAPDVHLRSMQEMTSYDIEGQDGKFGELEDFYVETDDWSVCYLGVDTHNFWSGKHVLIATQWLGQINWAQRKVSVDLTSAQIENSPDFDKVTEISREYETRLHKHYGQPASKTEELDPSGAPLFKEE
ncbi:MAG TPA: PRC-barrel domain-containing protein [Pyrinomonadaceae bacterium]|jgi:stress response protein YsnF